ncbi:hypothetical protein JZ751_019544 [Albula glossodonta]|uniref:AP-3 complex subunit beta n=1 Tax=Albula glossodonta TaxID=121402 RepID=A0A8T2N407_9TELE|nr:hypothetical protein JZ751_019544 [Albula glossodonta]
MRYRRLLHSSTPYNTLKRVRAHEDLKEMLDSNKDSLKLEAMRRVIAVKKLVSEVTTIVPIMMLAIKEAASDMSPYVRKTAAHAIPKLYSLDPEQKDPLIEVIEKLLADKTTLVAGSVVMAFEQVCPDRIELIHKNFRKLCSLLADGEEEADDGGKGKQAYVMDPDHRLLLHNTKPLLQSRNAAVVMAVAQLYFHLAPRAEVCVIAKAMVRLMRSHSEVQYVVLQNVATISIKRRGMFEPYLKSFYLRTTDPTQIKILKLEVLTNLASETNISTILREFQTYIKSADKASVAATIQAIGRCAACIGEVRDACLTGLVQLLSNQDELIVAESVVVIKKLLQMQPEKHSDIIRHMGKLIDNIQVPMARASILWLIGEYCEHVPKIGPDVLRKMAKSFLSEDDIVKLQIINLAAKLCLTNSKQTKLLTHYVLNVAKYDQNYDIRDRARFIRQLIIPNDKSGALSKYAKKLFLAQKPAPALQSPFTDREHFQLGSLSHLLNTKASGYLELPEWPAQPPHPSVRNVEQEDVISPSEGRIGLLGDWREVPVPEWTKRGGREKKVEKRSERPFYSDSEAESGSTESSDNEPDMSSESEASRGSSSESPSRETEESLFDEEDQEVKHDKKERKRDEQELTRIPSSPVEQKEVRKSAESSSASESYTEDEQSESESSDSESGQDSESDSQTNRKMKTNPSKPSMKKPPKSESEEAEVGLSLLDLDDSGSAQPPQVTCFSKVPPNSLVSDLEGLSLSLPPLAPPPMCSAFSSLKTYELLHRITGEGLGAEYCFSRQPFSTDVHMVAVQIQLTNSSDSQVRCLSIHQPRLAPGMRVSPFPEIGQLTGMNAIGQKLTVGEECRTGHSLAQRVTSAANLKQIPSTEQESSTLVIRFAGRTVSSGSLVLVTVSLQNDHTAQLTVNCEKMVIGTMLVKDVLQALSQ